jgi:thioesterase domain-containing protein/acyl carrier protein
MDRLPLTPHGKIDRAALPPPNSAARPAGRPLVRPRTPTEKVVVSIWRDLLQVEQVSIYDDFFELGGHSLLGIQLFARIEDQFDQRLPLALLFSAPTVAKLASHLEQPNVVVQSATIVPIQNSGERTPFFCVHGFGGGVLGYADLARLLGPEQPFYGLQAVGLSGDADPDASVETMAGRYVAAMRRVQPSGPYLIGGYCFGGVVAFEMARQLEAVGEPVPLLAIMEGNAPRQYRRQTPLLSWRRWHIVWQNIPYWLGDYWSLGIDGLRLRINRRGRIWYKQLQRRLGKDVNVNAQDVLPDDLSVVPAHHRRLFEIHLLALRSYAPAPITGRVTLFAARGKTINQALFGYGDPENGWGALARGGVKIVTVDGGHRNIHLQPHVASLAAALEAELQSIAGAVNGKPRPPGRA